MPKALRQVADVQHSSLLHPYFSLMGYIYINVLYFPVARQTEVGMHAEVHCVRHQQFVSILFGIFTSTVVV